VARRGRFGRRALASDGEGRSVDASPGSRRFNLPDPAADAANVQVLSSRRAIARELAPFAVAALLAFVLAPVGSEFNWSEYAFALGLFVAVVVGTVLAPWTRLRAAPRLVLPVAFLVAAALLRDAGGGINSGVAVLALLPVFWVALHDSRMGLVVMVLGVGMFFALPVLTLGAPAYPASGLRTGALFMVVAGLVGATVQRLVREVRAQVELGRGQARELHAAAREREALLARLERQALTDPLTGTANRRAWDRWLDRATDLRAPQPFAIGVLDLDFFKAFNDQYGHGAGDALLAEAATAWRAALRPGDELARIGGEEFAVILPSSDVAGAAATLRRLAGLTPRGQTCSGGAAEWDGIEAPDALMRRADDALYAAKRAGRNRIEHAGASPLRLAG
jgi:diguanylate cyclase (GGDEF)-like protein